MALPKWTTDQTTTLHIPSLSRTITIPPNSGVQPNIMAVHTHPQYWYDPLTWNPRRWIKTTDDPFESEELVNPKRGTFIPWSDGPQNCLGVKFSQVEFVAVIARLLIGHKLGVVKEREDETDEEVRERVWKVVNECDAQMLLRMKNPDRTRVRLDVVA